MKRIFKYGTGDTVPEGAEYMTTITDDRDKTRYVWHYFLIDDKWVSGLLHHKEIEKVRKMDFKLTSNQNQKESDTKKSTSLLKADLSDDALNKHHLSDIKK